jgi:FkbM family methyltransferase
VPAREPGPPAVTTLTLAEFEQLNPRCELQHEGVTMVFATPTQHTRWRVDTIFTKEPDTLAWIASFERDDVLVDVGANVGMYSIWAATTRGVKVFGFEPEAQNYALFNRNVQLNGLEERVKGYCVALSDVAGLSELHLSEVMIGGSCHSLGERVDFKHEPMRPAFSQGCVAARLDDLVASGAVAQPTHIKIDVDGFEPKVAHGAGTVLRDSRLRSVLVEINQNLADHQELVAELESLDFRYDAAQVARAERKQGAFKGCAEYVFRR